MNIKYYDGCSRSGKMYGGDSGLKKGILYQGEKWLLKYPKSTNDMNNVRVSYTTSPLSEYIGSHIYEILGFPVHETNMGIADGKLVVACKDFVQPGKEFFDFRSIKNDYLSENSKYFESHSSESGGNTDLNSALMVVKNNLKNVEGASERFWDMFVIDAFINNNDRNNGNWGYLYDQVSGKIELAPIFDNGGSFYNKKTDSEFTRFLSNDRVLHDNAVASVISAYEIDRHKIHAFLFMEEHHNEYAELSDAILRNSERIDNHMTDIKQMISEIPEFVIHDDVKYQVMSDTYKEYIYAILDIRKEKLHELAEEIIREREEEQYIIHSDYER